MGRITTFTHVTLNDLELDEYYVFHAIRADFLRRLRRNDEAVRDYEAAIALTDNGAEQAFLQQGIRQSLQEGDS